MPAAISGVPQKEGPSAGPRTAPNLIILIVQNRSHKFRMAIKTHCISPVGAVQQTDAFPGARWVVAAVIELAGPIGDSRPP